MLGQFLKAPLRFVTLENLLHKGNHVILGDAADKTRSRYLCHPLQGLQQHASEPLRPDDQLDPVRRGRTQPIRP
jgi:hypothetical protein